ncbi:restriction endonuclease [Micromonospora kangleipakensis]|uniref:Restriction endonuclease n=2 Tax=Micromonospora kangleipakensis TaxID=1077942 RepID=A0A4Q8BJ87_9ACTN|nr:restriction endonuclease [Micromonospora kangleipakensis]
MLQSSGYRLLTNSSQDEIELVNGSNGLRVRGRGAEHQADVLGELAYVPPFSLPLRMFVEAKCYRSTPVGLKEVRNAHGVIHDVNQNWAASHRTGRPRQRYHYLYSLFSTSGFTAAAQEYAQAHQLVLVDLSAPAFARLRRRLTSASSEMLEAASSDNLAEFPLTAVRAVIRSRLGTASFARDQGPQLPLAVNLHNTIEELVSFVIEDWRAKMLLGFPAAPIVLAMFVPAIDAAIAALSENPVQHVRLRHVGATDTAGTWVASSQDGRVEFRFTLPDRIESWIMADPDEYRARRAAFKNAFLSDITIVYSDEGDVRIFKLVYDASDWHQS